MTIELQRIRAISSTNADQTAGALNKEYAHSCEEVVPLSREVALSANRFRVVFVVYLSLFYNVKILIYNEIHNCFTENYTVFFALFLH